MSLKRNVFYSVFQNLLNLIFPIITVPYAARVLGVDNIGRINFSTTYVSYFALFAGLGINYYGVREIAKYQKDFGRTSKIFSELFFVTVVSTIIVSIIFLLTINTIPILRKERAILLIAGVSLYLVPTSIDWFFQAREDFKAISIRSLAIKFLAFVALFVFVQKKEDLIPYLYLSSFSILGANIWNFIFAYRTGLRITFKKLYLKPHIKPLLLFLASNLSVSIFIMLDVIMLGFLSTYKEVGYFTSPNRVLMLIMMSFGAINTVLLPRIAANKFKKNDQSNKELLQRTFDFTALFIVPLSIGLCLISARFIPLFFGKEFSGSIIPMQILSFKVIVVMINSFFALNVLAALGFESKFLIVVSFTALLSFVLNLIIIPKHGAVGAAIVAVMAETFEIFLNLYFVYRHTNIRVSWVVMNKSLIFALPFFLLYYCLNRFVLNDIEFLIIFATSAFSSYLILQLSIGKNYLLIQLYKSTVARKRHENTFDI